MILQSCARASRCDNAAALVHTGKLPPHACRHRDILEVLLDHAVRGAASTALLADPQADALGRSPLHFAAANGDYGAAQLLLARGANVDVSLGARRKGAQVEGRHGRLAGPSGGSARQRASYQCRQWRQRQSAVSADHALPCRASCAPEPCTPFACRRPRRRTPPRCTMPPPAGTGGWLSCCWMPVPRRTDGRATAPRRSSPLLVGRAGSAQPCPRLCACLMAPSAGLAEA